MALTPLFIGPTQKQQLQQLKEKAEANPVDMPTLVKAIKTPEGQRKHLTQMTEQTIELPAAFTVTFSIKDSHPLGRTRHLSLAVNRKHRVPSESAVWMVAVELGFWGPSVQACDHMYMDKLNQGNAVNIIQVYDQPLPI